MENINGHLLAMSKSSWGDNCTTETVFLNGFFGQYTLHIFL